MNIPSYPLTPKQRFELNPRNKGSSPDEFAKCGSGDIDPSTEEYRRTWPRRRWNRWSRPRYGGSYNYNPFMWPYYSSYPPYPYSGGW